MANETAERDTGISGCIKPPLALPVFKCGDDVGLAAGTVRYIPYQEDFL